MGRPVALNALKVDGDGRNRPGLGRVALTAADLGAAAGAAAALISALGAHSSKADQVANFTPFWAAAGLVAGAASVALSPPRRRLGRALVPLVTLIGAVCIMAPELVARVPSAAPSAKTFRILTLNTWILNKEPDRTLRWIEAQKADALVMSELQPWSPIRAALLRDYPHLVPCRENGPCSTVIMTREAPIRDGGLATDDADRRKDISAVWATVPAPGGPITILGLHLDHPGYMGTGRDEIAKLRDFMAGRDRSRLVVIGDTNRTVWSHAIRVLDATFGITRVTHGVATWPAGRAYPPLFGIDQAYVGNDLGVARLERSPDVGSDHRGLVLDVADRRKT